LRKAAFARGQGQAAELLADWLAGQGGRVLAGYMPMRTEIDPLPAMAAHRGPVGVPVIPGPAMPLKFREWTPGCALVPGAFGALIPAEGAWLEPEVLIVPLLAFDARATGWAMAAASTTARWRCCARAGRRWRWALPLPRKRWPKCRSTPPTSGWTPW
jgi:hypothetical protein